jgi:exodeoxyribonuclease-5
MLPQDIINDLHRLSKKILYLGDPFQLPPIKGDQIMEPDFFLTDVHRQSLESPILRAATDVRIGKRLEYSKDGDFIYGVKKNLDVNLWYRADQTIVGRNVTRRKWNGVFLKHHGLEESINKKPSGSGEKVICLKNSRERGLFNGMIGNVFDTGKDDKGRFTIDFNCDGEKYIDIPAWEKIFEGYDGIIDRDIRNKYELFDYGYAITCHKSQGSEFDNVLIYNEPVGRTVEEIARWKYTAITRARKKCILVDP